MIKESEFLPPVGKDAVEAWNAPIAIPVADGLDAIFAGSLPYAGKVSLPEEPSVAPEAVNHPSHYTAGGIETIDFLQAKLSAEGFYGFCIGNLVKYVSRAGLKGAALQDLEKAEWYLKKAIEARKTRV